jgi:transcriptional regulator with XRE-family HTH domain
MSPRDAFGPNLRRLRLARGVSLHALVRATNVCASLWEGLERNDLSRWPAGIYARAYVREYAHAIGEDAESLVDEFCRCFPQADQRVVATIHEQARAAWHASQWRDELAKMIEGGSARSSSRFGRLRRACGLA